jgi:hypothetical protein
MSDVDRQDIEKAIKAIQDIAIMLTAASEFVCEAKGSQENSQKHSNQMALYRRLEKLPQE